MRIKNRLHYVFSLPFCFLLLSLNSCSEADQLPASELSASFSGESAMRHVEQLVGLGPRPAGSEALEKSGQYIEQELEKAGWKVLRQEFEAPTPFGNKTFVNLIAHFQKSFPLDLPSPHRYMVSSHYDTKYYSTFEFVGANDGGSSTGILIELAHQLSQTPSLAHKVELVFFDGEEAFLEYSAADGLYGSRHYSQLLRTSGRNQQFRAGVLLDMVGDKDFNVSFPPNSAPEVVRGLMKAAESFLGEEFRKKFSLGTQAILDDHVPLNQAGVKTANMIDFDYKYWHTPEDTLDKLAPESLRIAGAVVLEFLFQSEQNE